MKNKSLLEDIIETAIKNPAAGVILSVFFLALGSYLTNKQAPIGAKPNEMIFLPAMHLFGKFSYLLSTFIFIFAGIAYVVNSIKSKLMASRATRKLKDMTQSPTNVAGPKNNDPRFKTKEEYFKWKDSVLSGATAPQSKPDDLIDRYYQSVASEKEQNNEPVKNEETAWTLDSLYDALGKIDWYQFEKFSAALLRSEGYTVERKGGAHPDGGVDLIAIKDSDTMLVQCKHWKTWDIKPKTVREMIGTMMINKTNKGALYILKGATIAAKELAIQQGILIEEGYSLANRALRQLTKEQLDKILNTYVHHCPKCEAEMVWREGNFKPFWGCSRYPKCQGRLKDVGAPDSVRKPIDCL